MSRLNFNRIMDVVFLVSNLIFFWYFAWVSQNAESRLMSNIFAALALMEIISFLVFGHLFIKHLQEDNDKENL